MAAHRMLLFPNLVRNPRIYRHKACDLDVLDDSRLRQRYRFSRDSILFITDLITEDLEHPTNRSHSLSAEQQVLLAPRFYASGSFLQLVGDLSGFDKGTASRIVVRVTDALVAHRLVAHRDDFIKWPSTPEERNRIHAGFYEIASFPNIVGCVDGTKYKALPPHSGTMS
jgi:hypothetical protein